VYVGIFDEVCCDVASVVDETDEVGGGVLLSDAQDGTQIAVVVRNPITTAERFTVSA
jgi:hypothetical protein